VQATLTALVCSVFSYFLVTPPHASILEGSKVSELSIELPCDPDDGESPVDHSGEVDTVIGTTTGVMGETFSHAAVQAHLIADYAPLYHCRDCEVAGACQKHGHVEWSYFELVSQSNNVWKWKSRGLVVEIYCTDCAE